MPAAGAVQRLEATDLFVLGPAEAPLSLLGGATLPPV